ncbi:porin [Pseudorhodoferax sp.]|uniref:porin n=1 Tax=Pseudorhodoferax sp. TaxID=1993553 RepID=UPI002DD66D08|nr:porin [Pseudorhodoferax sp.]
MTRHTPAALAAGALLAAAATAQAQSSVTIYGVADAALSIANAGNGAPHQQRLDSAVGQGSRLGFRGHEDLGDGLRALFTMEMGFSLGTGAFQQGGLPWGRQIFAGLGGRQWSVTMGRQYSPSLLAVQAADAFGQNYWGSSVGYGIGTLQSPGSAASAGAACQGASARINNAVVGSYTAGGLTGRLMFGGGDQDARKTGRYLSPGFSYSNGPLMLTGAYARMAQCAPEITATASPAWQTEATLGGSVDAGAARLFAGYYLWDPSEDQRARPPTYLKQQAYWIGTRVRVGGTGTLIAQVARLQQKRAGADATGTSLGLTYEHLLSKRTRVYVSAARMWNGDHASFSLAATTVAQAANGAGADPRVLSFGLTHAF